MFVEVINAITDSARESQRSRNVTPASEARDDHLLRNCIAVPQDVSDGSGPLSKRAPLRCSSKHKIQGRRQTRADGLVVLLQGTIIGFVKFANAGSVAATTKIFKKQCV